MKTHTEKPFLAWAAKNGMEIDQRYPACAVLVFNSNPNIERFWDIPARPERRPYFLRSMLNLMGGWNSCFVWRHMGSWPSEATPDRVNDTVEFQILSGLGIPMGTADIVQFDRAEIDRLVTLLFSTTVFAWSVGEDLYVIPDHAHYLMKTSHHDVVNLSFRGDVQLQQFVKGMKDVEFPLPVEVPDSTFKRPKWMNQ